MNQFPLFTYVVFINFLAMASNRTRLNKKQKCDLIEYYKNNEDDLFGDWQIIDGVNRNDAAWNTGKSLSEALIQQTHNMTKDCSLIYKFST